MSEELEWPMPYAEEIQRAIEAADGWRRSGFKIDGAKEHLLVLAAEVVRLRRPEPPRREAEQRVIDDALDALYSALPFVEDADPKYYHKGFPKRMEWRVRAAIGKIEALKKDAGYLTPPPSVEEDDSCPRCMQDPGVCKCAENSPSVEQVKPAPKDDELTIARAYAIVGKHSNFAGYHCVECGAFWYPTGYGKEWHEPGCAKAVPPAQECDDCFGVGKVPNTAMTEMRDCLKCKPAAPSDAKAQERP